MGSLRLSTIVVASVVVCLYILLLSPTEVEGACDIPNGICWPGELFQEPCKDRCLGQKRNYYDGTCIPTGDILSPFMNCMCCRYDASRAQ